MDIKKLAGYILYAIGIVGGAEGVIKKSLPISIIAVLVIVGASVLMSLKDKGE